MKQVISNVSKISLLALCLSLSLNSIARSKATTPTKASVPNLQESNKNATLYGYVAKVFDKLQSNWEYHAFANQTAEAMLTFILNEDGSLESSGLNQGTNTNAGQELLDYLKSQAPFGAFPVTVKGTQLEFKFKLADDSLQMLSYQLLPPRAQNSVVVFATPVPNQPQPVSLFYTRVGTPGRIWENPSKLTADDQAMSAYIAQVQEQIKASWQLPEDYMFQRTIATLMIDRNGTLLSATIKSSSGDITVDKAALSAIYSAGKFPVAPINVPSLPVTIDYIFEPVLTSAE